MFVALEPEIEAFGSWITTPNGLVCSELNAMEQEWLDRLRAAQLNCEGLQRREDLTLLVQNAITGVVHL